MRRTIQKYLHEIKTSPDYLNFYANHQFEVADMSFDEFDRAIRNSFYGTYIDPRMYTPDKQFDYADGLNIPLERTRYEYIVNSQGWFFGLSTNLGIGFLGGVCAGIAWVVDWLISHLIFS